MPYMRGRTLKTQSWSSKARPSVAEPSRLRLTAQQGHHLLTCHNDYDMRGGHSPLPIFLPYSSEWIKTCVPLHITALVQCHQSKGGWQKIGSLGSLQCPTMGRELLD
ncbi:Uncharacterized protein Adt_42778 [Abeliophyllum distichum]|uniref:Uncharacterized protein n=1 Tax=Abeliophyllum distichum TaxID=126358 RepID=A0ABD1PTL0_9LAMI